MDDLQAPPSEPPGSGSEPTSDPLKSISLTSTAPWPPELRPGEGQLVRPFEARQRTERFPQGADTRAFRRRFFPRSEEHTSELQSLMRISYAVFCLKKKKNVTHLSR